MKKLLASAAIAAAAFGAAQAAILDLTDRSDTVVGTYDFGDGLVDVYSGVPKPQSDNPLHIKIGLTDIVVRITGIGGTTNANENPRNDCAAVTGLVCESDGLGINDDEISHSGSTPQSVQLEFLNINDGKAAPITITSLAFLDLFYKKGTLPDDLDPAVNQESAIAELTGNAGTTVVTTLASSEGGGGLGYALNGSVVSGITKIVFYPGAGKDDGTGDFALAAVGFEVPIPGAVPLFLAGLGGLVAARRRRVA